MFNNTHSIPDWSRYEEEVPDWLHGRNATVKNIVVKDSPNVVQMARQVARYLYREEETKELSETLSDRKFLPCYH